MESFINNITSLSPSTVGEWLTILGAGTIVSIVLMFITPHIERKGWKIGWLGILSAFITFGDTAVNMLNGVPTSGKFWGIIGAATMMYKLVLRKLAVSIEQFFVDLKAGRALRLQQPTVEEFSAQV